MIIDSVDLLRMACMNRDGSTPPRECPPLIVPSVGELLEAADELERLRAEVEALRGAADCAKNAIILGSIQGRKADRDEFLRKAHDTLDSALKEHTNGR